MRTLVALLFGLFALTSQAANISGSVLYKGKPVKPAAINMKANPECKSEHPVTDETIVTSGGKLANVFVYVEGAKSTAPAPAEPVTVDQQGCHYVPHVLGVRVGQKIKFVNSDPGSHNVHAMPKSQPPFNAATPTKGMSIEREFKKAEPMIHVKCDIHGWMSAYISSVDTPYFAVSGNDGSFTIKDLPAGEYTLVAMHEKLGKKETKIKVTDAGAAAPIEFTFQ